MAYRKKRNKKKKNSISPVLISGIVLALLTLYLSYRLYTFHLLPKLWRLMIMAVLVLLAGIFLVLSILRKKKGKILMIIEIILCFLIATGSITLPYIEKRIESLFSTRMRTYVQDFHVYTLTQKYRTQHPDLPLPEAVSNNLLNYTDAVFLYPQSSSDTQRRALELLKRDLGEEISLRQEPTLWATLLAFYNGEAECILLSDPIVDMIEESEEYAQFSNDTLILRTFPVEIEVEDDLSSKISEKAFTVFIAGNDTRSGVLSVYGRTDVDILLTVNPETAQALIISIPRDTYLQNPALNNGMDKLTHLGNDGIMNTVRGLNNLYDLDTRYYATVNFVTFKKIIDTLGGIDIYNPYEFQGIQRYFYAGNIHLNGEDALDYVRERHTLASGDYDRNEHQAIVLQAVLQKLTSRAILEKTSNLLNDLSGSVATNIDPSSILDLASEELISEHNWNIVYYHLGGYGTRAETVSMPGAILYVVYPFESQVKFVKEEIMNVLTGQIIEKKNLPDNEKTVFEYN